MDNPKSSDHPMGEASATKSRPADLHSSSKINEGKVWGFASFEPKEDKFEECYGLVQIYVREVEEEEPELLKLSVQSMATTSWFAGRRVVEANGVISLVEEFSTYDAYLNYQNCKARQKLNKALYENDVARSQYGEVLMLGGFQRE